MLNLIIFGPPGAGKGTQAIKLAEKYELIHLSTGDILRKELSSATALGVEAQKFMDEGELVPDEIVVGMIKKCIEENEDAKGFIFDGFPRTTAQAGSLDAMLEEKKMPIKAVLFLEVEQEELKTRLLNRGKDSGRTDDKDEEIIANRLAVYLSETSPLLEFYEKEEKLQTIHGMGEVEEIFVRLSEVVETLDEEKSECCSNEDESEKSEDYEETEETEEEKCECDDSYVNVYVEIGDVKITNGRLNIEIGDFELKKGDVKVRLGEFELDGADVKIEIGDFEFED